MIYETEIQIQPYGGNLKDYIIGKGSVPFVQVYTPKKMRKYMLELEKMIKREGVPQTLMTGAMEVELICFFDWRKSELKSVLNQGIDFHITKPDPDNLSKPILDVLSGLVIKDDRFICDLIVRKRRTNKGSLRIKIRQIYFDTTENMMGWNN